MRLPTSPRPREGDHLRGVSLENGTAPPGGEWLSHSPNPDIPCTDRKPESFSPPWLQRPGSRVPGDRLLSFSRRAVEPRTQLRCVRSEMRADATTSLAPIRDARTMRYGRRLEDERIGGCAPWEPIADADSIAVKPAEAADRRTEVHSIRRRLPSSNGWPPCSRRRMIQILNFVSGRTTQRRNFSHQILCALSTIILKVYRF